MLNLITNRTGGYYNISDLNRVEAAVQYLANLWESTRNSLIEYGDSIEVDAADIYGFNTVLPEMTYKLDWDRTDVPTMAAMERYLSNVKTLKSISQQLLENLPISMSKLTYIGANEIEKFLLNVEQIIARIDTNAKKLMDSAKDMFIYSGEIYGGEW